MITRRSALGGLAATGVAAGTSAHGAAPSTGQPPDLTMGGRFSLPMDPPQPQGINGLLLNEERARAILEAEKVDLLICSKLANYYYLTGRQPSSLLLGYDAGIDYATLSAHDDGKPTLITSQVTLFLHGTEQAHLDRLNIVIVGRPADPQALAELTDPAAIADAEGLPTMIRRNTLHPESTTERFRHEQVVRESEDIRASVEAALIKQVLDNPLPNRTVAIDDLRIKELLQRSGKDLRFVDGERLIRKIRIQKTDAELELMRYAAAANAAAGRAAAMSVRDGAGFDELRSEFWKHCGTRDTTPVYMMVDTLIPRMSHGTVEEGRTFLIDCVSTFGGYHGDYGRTVCVGEPNRDMARIVKALSQTWNRILEELRPGLRFSEIRERGRQLFAETNLDVGFALNPHTIGLHHSDDENVAGFGNYRKADIALEENMVLSVDLPLLDSGLGGTAHLEDLVIITKDGPELLNDSSDRFIVV